MKKKRIAIVTACFAAGVGFGFWFLTEPESDSGRAIQIRVLDSAAGIVVVTNTGSVTIDLAVSCQVMSNGAWHPPKESLFKNPVHVLGGNDPDQGADTSEGTRAVHFQFLEQASGAAAWRVVVLCQKHYNEALPTSRLGRLIERYVTKRGSFSESDHRGAHDSWKFSERIEPAVGKP